MLEKLLRNPEEPPPQVPFNVATLQRDLGQVLGEGEEVGDTPRVPLTQLCHEILSKTVQGGMGESDPAAVVHFLDAMHAERQAEKSQTSGVAPRRTLRRRKLRRRKGVEAPFQSPVDSHENQSIPTHAEGEESGAAVTPTKPLASKLKKATSKGRKTSAKRDLITLQDQPYETKPTESY